MNFGLRIANCGFSEEQARGAEDKKQVRPVASLLRLPNKPW